MRRRFEEGASGRGRIKGREPGRFRVEPQRGTRLAAVRHEPGRDE